jgi:hypothetical protein
MTPEQIGKVIGTIIVYPLMAAVLLLLIAFPVPTICVLVGLSLLAALKGA